jgi:uncharacterized protein
MRKPIDPDAITEAIARGERSCGDFSMRIARDGTWYYQGSPIGRLPLVKLFASVLRRAADGRYWLVTPAEQGLIEVEDVPFVAVELVCSGSGPGQQVRLRTNLDEWVTVDDAHPLEMRILPDGTRAPYLRIRDSLDARVSRSAFYHLVWFAEPSPDGVEEVLGVWSSGRFFPLGSVDD